MHSRIKRLKTPNRFSKYRDFIRGRKGFPWDCRKSLYFYTMSRISIAIDGYSSTGKSTVAKRLAEALDYLYIDSGAMYRAVTYYALENGYLGQEEENYPALLEKLDDINLEFQKDPETGDMHIYLNGKNVEHSIRNLEVSNYVSRVAEFGEIRDKMVKLQRKIARDNGVVMDGRDIGTVVLPDAELKIFMTAQPKIRALRRFEELKARGDEVDFEQVERNIESRDHIDTNRKIAPLKRADDAILIDNSHMDLDEQFKRVLELAHDAIEAQKKGC